MRTKKYIYSYIPIYKKKIFFFFMQGISRSTAVGMAYLIWKEKISAEEALRAIK